MPRRWRRWLSICSAILLTLLLPAAASGQMRGGFSLPQGTSVQPNASGSLGTRLPVAGSVPPSTPLASSAYLAGVSLPPDLSLPPSLLKTLEGGALPSHISSTDLKAILDIPQADLPPQVGALRGVLTRLASNLSNSPTAEQVACEMNNGNAGGAPFRDLSGVPWAEGSVTALASAGIVQGEGGGMFDPQGVLTQQQLLTMLMRALGPGSAPGNGTPVNGVATWAQPSVQEAMAEGLLSKGGGIALAPNSVVDRYQAVTLLTRALGLGSLAQAVAAQPYPFQTSGPVPPWAQGAVTLAERLGLAEGMGQGHFGGSAPLTRAEVAAFLARGIRLLHEAEITSDQGVIAGVVSAPAGSGPQTSGGVSSVGSAGCPASSLEAGRTVQITGQGFGQSTGTVVWEPAQGSPESWSASAWSDNAVAVHVPGDAATGKGRLIVQPQGGGSVAARITVVGPLKLAVGEPLPTGMVGVSWRGQHTAYMSPQGVSALRRLPPASLQQVLGRLAVRLKQVDAQRPQTVPPQFPSPHPMAAVSRSQAFRVQEVPLAASESVRLLPLAITYDESGGGTNPCINTSCTAYYGPQATITSPTPQQFTSTGFAAAANNFCTTEYIVGTVCSSTSTQEATGSNAGDFVEIGAAWGEWSYVNMNAYLTAYYTPRAAGDLVKVQVEVFTHQVGGGIQAMGGGCSPLDVGGRFGLYTPGVQPALSNVTQSQDRAASCLATSSIGIPTTDVPEGNAADLADTALSKLQSALSDASTLWNSATTVAGVLGANQESTFSWCGIVPGGEGLQVQLDPQAQIEQAAEIPGTQINLVRGIAMVQVTETLPQPC